MPARNIAVSQRESYFPSRFTEFLWWLSTAEKELLVDAVIDRNRYRIIGMTVLATWSFASFAWIYFFSTIVDSLLFAVLLGLFMGFIILTIDRTLIKGITKINKQRFTPLLFRGLLALTIGTFMAQPAILYMFSKEIKLQVSLDNEKKKQLKRQQQDLFYSKQKNELINKHAGIQKEFSVKYHEVAKAREIFLVESDGSGGTGKIGLKDIALAKKKEYQKIDNEYQELVQKQQPQLDSINAGLKKIESNILAATVDFDAYLNDGFLTRIEALNNILKDNRALKFRYYLIVFILMLIELLPVLAKTMLPSGTYEEKQILREQMEIDIAHANIKREKELKECYNQLSFESDSEAIRTFFKLSKADRNEKIISLSKKWKDDKNQSFDGIWEKIKKDILTKQEN